MSIVQQAQQHFQTAVNRPLTTPAQTAPPKPAQPKQAQKAAQSATPAVGAAAGNAMADPSYQAYLRGMGVEEAEIQNILGTRVGALTRKLGRQLPAYAARKEHAEGQVDTGYEDRGFYRSGARLQERARVGLEHDRERLDFEAETRDNMADLYSVSALDIARLRREQTERAIEAQRNTAIANAEAGIF